MFVNNLYLLKLDLGKELAPCLAGC